MFAAAAFAAGCRTPAAGERGEIPLESFFVRTLPGCSVDRPHPGALLVRWKPSAGSELTVLAFDLRRRDLHLKPALARAATFGPPGPGEPLASLRLRNGAWAAASGGSSEMHSGALAAAVIDGVAIASPPRIQPWGFAIRDHGAAEIRRGADSHDRYFLPAEAVLLLNGRAVGDAARRDERFDTAWARTALCAARNAYTVYWVESRQPHSGSGETLDRFVRRLRGIGCRDAVLSATDSYAGIDYGMHAFRAPNASPVAFAWIAIAENPVMPDANKTDAP